MPTGEVAAVAKLAPSEENLHSKVSNRTKAAKTAISIRAQVPEVHRQAGMAQITEPVRVTLAAGIDGTHASSLYPSKSILQGPSCSD